MKIKQDVTDWYNEFSSSLTGKVDNLHEEVLKMIIKEIDDQFPLVSVEKVSFIGKDEEIIAVY